MLAVFFTFLRCLFPGPRNHRELVLALRHSILVLQRQGRRPNIISSRPARPLSHDCAPVDNVMLYQAELCCLSGVENATDAPTPPTPPTGTWFGPGHDGARQDGEEFDSQPGEGGAEGSLPLGLL